MLKLDWKKAAFLGFVLFGSVPMIGCEQDGSAGKVGKNIDKTLDPRGPGQKIGDKIDNATK